MWCVAKWGQKLHAKQGLQGLNGVGGLLHILSGGASWKPVTAPMVGTFYAAPSPDADPFVKEGDKVNAGDPLCIVEAMKLMNEIPAEEMCVVREVCVNNADPVEYGTVMFYIEPVTE